MLSQTISDDLVATIPRTKDLWPLATGSRIFLSGGTGFFGSWLLESLLNAEDRLALGLTVTVLTRNPTAFISRRPHLAGHRALSLHEGDVRDFKFPSGDFDLTIHAAAEAQAAVALNSNHPAEFFDVMVSGTRRMLEFAAKKRAKRFLFTSSGAIYGDASAYGALTPEEARSGPDPMSFWSAIAEGKRAAECLCACAARGGEAAVIVARCFAFVGPYFPLESHFAIGNFLRQANAGEPIIIKGDGTARRSYLYASDLATWLWTLLLRGQSGRAYNVGSEHAISIAELARLISTISGGNSEVIVEGKAPPAVAPASYAPSTARARTELGLTETVPLRQSVERTMDWVREIQRAARS